jgi:uncharacterized protein
VKEIIMKLFLKAAVLAMATFALPVIAQAPDPILEAARVKGLIGEQADGYLGFVTTTANAELKAHVSQINIKRKAFYTDLAGKRNVSPNEVGGATACELFKTRVGENHFYMDETGKWIKRVGAEAVKLPSFCPQ